MPIRMLIRTFPDQTELSDRCEAYAVVLGRRFDRPTTWEYRDEPASA